MDVILQQINDTAKRSFKPLKLALEDGRFDEAKKLMKLCLEVPVLGKDSHRGSFVHFDENQSLVPCSAIFRMLSEDFAEDNRIEESDIAATYLSNNTYCNFIDSLVVESIQEEQRNGVNYLQKISNLNQPINFEIINLLHKYGFQKGNCKDILKRYEKMKKYMASKAFKDDYRNTRNSADLFDLIQSFKTQIKIHSSIYQYSKIIT